MPECSLSGIQSIRYGIEKTGLVLDQAKAVQHFLVRYWTEIIDTRMLMPALASSMPMPSYANHYSTV
jgi:hypothetical protein